MNLKMRPGSYVSYNSDVLYYVTSSNKGPLNMQVVTNSYCRNLDKT